jgi:hypothetical protein
VRWRLTAERASGALVPWPLVVRELAWRRVRLSGVEVRVLREAELAGSAPPAPSEQAPPSAPEDGPGRSAPRVDPDFLPEIEDLAADAAPAEGGRARPGEPSAAAAARPWSYAFRDVRVEDLREVWADDRRFRGRATARGGFALRRRATAEILRSELRAEGLTLLAGGRELARDVRGTARLRFAPWRYRGARLRAVLARADGEIELAGEVAPDEVLDWLFTGWPALELDSQPSRIEARFALARGRLRAGSRVEVANGDQRVRFLGFEARGDARLTAAVDGRWGRTRLETRLELGRWRLGRPGEPVTLVGEGLRLVARAEEPRLDAPPRAAQLELDLGRGSLPDLGFVNELLPAAAQIRIESGSATVGGELRVVQAGPGGPPGGEGVLRLRGSGLRLTAAGQSLSGDLEADLRLAEPDLATPAFSIAGSKLALREVAAVTSAGDRVRGWWGEVSLARGRVVLARPASLGGLFDARLSDTRPMVAFYELRRDLPEWGERLLTVENVSASGGFEWTPGRLRIDDTTVPLAHGEVRAKLDLDRTSRRGRMLLSWRSLAVGVELEGGERSLRLRDAREWYASEQAPAAATADAAAATPAR